MTDEVWSDPKIETGLCILCARCRDDCLQSTQGWVCRECWQETLRNPDPPKNLPGRLAILPGPLQFGHLIVGADGLFLTVERTLFFFRRERHAIELLERIRNQEPGARVVRLAARIPFLYVLQRPELKMVFVKDVEGQEL